MISYVSTAPTVEPVTNSQIKSHLRIDHSDHDTMLDGLIQSARQHIENTLGRALVQQTRVVKYKNWPREDSFVLPYPPVQSVTSLNYTDTDDTESTFSSDNYSVVTNREPGLVVLGYSKVWPTATLHHDEYPIEITYVCGYEPTSDRPADYRENVPQPIKDALKMQVEIYYDRPPPDYRETLEQTIANLLTPYRVWSF